MPSTDPFAARMLAQVTLIERYRASVLRREGRRLDSDSAALEWIARYAEHFPSPEHFCRHDGPAGNALCLVTSGVTTLLGRAGYVK